MNKVLSINFMRLTYTNKYNRVFVANCTYPYRFGGIPILNIRENKSHTQLLKSKFGNNVFQGFKSAYIAVLQALKDKDKVFLESTMEQTLIQSIQFQDVELINKGKPIQMGCRRSSIVIGSQFERTQNNRQIIVLNKDQETNTLLLGNANFLKHLQEEGTVQKIPFLFCFDMYFISKIKLSQKESKINKNSQQIHYLRFQACIQKPIKGFMDKLLLMQIESNVDTFPLNIEQVSRQIVVKNFQWKISDVDNLLNGNFDIIKVGQQQ